MEHVSNDHKDNPSQHKSSQKLSDETSNLVLSLMKVHGILYFGEIYRFVKFPYVSNVQ